MTLISSPSLRALSQGLLSLGLAATTATSAVAQIAELVPTVFTVNRSTVVAGQSYVFDVEIKNNSFFKAGRHTTKIMVGHNATGTDAQDVATFRVPEIKAYSAYRARLSFSMPRALRDSTIHTKLWLLVDVDDEVREVDNFNNSKLLSVRTVARADLSVGNVVTTSTSWERGKSYAFSASVRNLGARGSSSTRTGIYLSADRTLTSVDRLLTSFDEAPLMASATRTHNRMVTIPQSASLGAAYIGYWVDDRGFVTEASEGNNTRVVVGAVEAQGSHTSFGAGCRGVSGVPTLSASGTPRIGQSSSYLLQNAGPRGAAILALGLSRTRFGGTTRLPLDLGFAGAAGCRIYTSHEILTSALVDRVGRASSRVLIPQRASLVGFEFYTQWLVISPASNKLGVITSNGMATKIGS